MIKYQTVWQREGYLLTTRFATYMSKGAKSFREDKDYRKNVEIGFIISLVLLTSVFLVSKRIERTVELQTVVLDTLVLETVDQTRQEARQAAPVRPTVPIVSEDEEIPEDATMEIGDFDDIYDPPPPPPPPEVDSDEIIFVAFSDPPIPVGGYGALHANINYPDMARMAGIEGTVVLNCKILEDGTIAEVRVLQSVNKVLDEAAENAVRSVKWLPAKQREDPVAVWFAVPIEFKLEG